MRSRTATGARRYTDAGRATKLSSDPVTCGKKASVERCARISDLSLRGVSSRVANGFVSRIYIRLGRSVGSF